MGCFISTLLVFLPILGAFIWARTTGEKELANGIAILGVPIGLVLLVSSISLCIDFFRKKVIIPQAKEKARSATFVPHWFMMLMLLLAGLGIIGPIFYSFFK